MNEVLCVIGLHDWEWGRHRLSGHEARRCVRARCRCAQEWQFGWIACYPSDVRVEEE